jgi:hypothetical protein
MVIARLCPFFLKPAHILSLTATKKKKRNIYIFEPFPSNAGRKWFQHWMDNFPTSTA